MAIKSAMDIAFYALLSLKTNAFLFYLSLFWTLFGSIGLITVLLLRQTHYLYTTTLGLSLLIGAIVGTATALFINNLPMLFLFYTLFHLAAYFYIDAYFKILPRPSHWRIKHGLKIALFDYGTHRVLCSAPSSFSLLKTFFSWRLIWVCWA